MTTTDVGILEAMLAHHAELGEGVARRVAELSAAVDAGANFEPWAGELVAYVADHVLPHAVAEEDTIYRAATKEDGLAETVAQMIDEHRRLAAALERLATTDDPRAAEREASAIGALFSAHVTKENVLLLPPLAASETVDMAALLNEMHRLTETASLGASAGEDVRAPDAESTLVALLLEAAGQLADAGHADRACRVVAGAWATLRAPRPDLAVRITAALHGLARTATAEPVRLTARPEPETPDDLSLDVRPMAPAQRHERIFATFEGLQPGHAFVLVNDHDPKPLRYQFEAEYAGRFVWDYLESGPRTWRVRIGRVPVEASR